MTLVPYCFFLCYRKEGPYEVYWGTKKQKIMDNVLHNNGIQNTNLLPLVEELTVTQVLLWVLFQHSKQEQTRSV